MIPLGSQQKGPQPLHLQLHTAGLSYDGSFADEFVRHKLSSPSLTGLNLPLLAAAVFTTTGLPTAQLQQDLTYDDALVQKAKHIAHDHQFANADVHG